MNLPIDPADSRQRAAVRVLNEEHPDRIVDTLVSDGMDRLRAIDLVADLLMVRVEHMNVAEAVRKERLRAVAAEWDVDTTMHGGN
jgi:hypothetical protein